MRYLLILSILLSFASCKSKKGMVKEKESANVVVPTNEVSSDSLFATYEKTACFGMCPIFKLTVYKSGLAFYEGHKNVDKIGLYKGNILIDDLSKLLKFAEEMAYFDMESVYDGNVSDLPSTIYMLNNGKRKQVLDRYQGPKKLDALGSQFNDLISTTKWDKYSAEIEPEKY